MEHNGPRKMRSGETDKTTRWLETTNQLEYFEYPCTFPPIPALEDQFCTEICTLTDLGCRLKKDSFHEGKHNAVYDMTTQAHKRGVMA